MDTIANLLTSIRNAEMAKLNTISVPSSKQSLALLELLKRTGYIADFAKTKDGSFERLSIKINESFINHEYTRVSKLGRRLYTTAKDIPVIKQGKGLVVISTSKGLMTGKEAKKLGLGGELVCTIC